MNPHKITPVDWRPSTSEEIKIYYKDAFPRTWKTLPEYLAKTLSEEYAFAFLRPVKTMDIGGIVKEKDFLRRENRGYGHDLNTLQKLLLNFRQFDPLGAVIENSQVESFYFSLRMKDRWLIAFDIDAKDIALSGLCEHHPGLRPDADDSEIINWRRMIGNIPPVHPKHIKDPEKGYLYCYNCIQVAVNKAFEAKKILMEWGFAPEDIHIYYSGQGAHIHVTDSETWSYPKDARIFIAKMLTKAEIPIDTPITIDSRRVLRFTGSLHAGVNRRVQELKHPSDLEDIIAKPNWSQ
ncbi:MAG: hypothetical protein WCE94_11855 [Candidatus Methanoperedens sp.]